MSERLQIALQGGIVAVVLVAALYGIVATATAPAPHIAAATIAPVPSPSLVAAPTQTPRPTPSPTPVPTATPTPAPRAPVTHPYQYGGHAYTVAVIPKGSTVVAPFDGRVELHRYQLVGGSIREGTAVEGAPVYPYVLLFAADGRKLTFRPGALGTDTALVAQDGQQVKAGDALFTVTGEGVSSWHDFYDPDLVYQVVVSLVDAGGADLDAASSILIR